MEKTDREDVDVGGILDWLYDMAIRIMNDNYFDYILVEERTA